MTPGRTLYVVAFQHWGGAAGKYYRRDFPPTHDLGRATKFGTLAEAQAKAESIPYPCGVACALPSAMAAAEDAAALEFRSRNQWMIPGTEGQPMRAPPQ